MLLAAFGACTLVGALASPLFRRALSMRAILLLELWTGLGIVAFVVWPNVYVLTAAFMVQGITLPVTDSVVEGYRIAVTPDRLLGRVETREEHDLAARGPARAAVRRPPADDDVRPRDGRVLRRVHARARALGHAEPVDPRAPSLDELDALTTA